MEAGDLATPRRGLQAAVIDNQIYVTGGSTNSTIQFANGSHFLNEILHWDSSTETWQEVGNLAVARRYHAAVAIPSYIIESDMLFK